MEHLSSNQSAIAAPATTGPHRLVALVYRVASTVAIGFGLIRITQIFSANPLWNSFAFYTVLSNVLCLIWMAHLAVITASGKWEQQVQSRPAKLARGSAMVMMAITVTLLVYLVVLVPASFTQDSNYVPFSLTDNLIHIITPALVIIDWLFFAPKGWLRWREPIHWCSLPYLYLAFAFIYGALGGEFYPGVHHPYPFMDLQEFGIGGVAVRILMLTVALVGFGYIYVVLDRLIARHTRRRRQA